MRAEKRSAWLAVAVAAILALNFFPLAAREIVPSASILVPYFEVDLNSRRPGDGLTTDFAVGNASGDPIDVQIVVYSNWGIPLIDARLRLQRTEVRRFAMRDWLVEGKLPDRTMSTAELAHVQAALSGKASPRDHLYYSTPVKDGLAVGYVTVKGPEDRKALWGDFYAIDESAGYFEADTLVNSDPSVEFNHDCTRHAIRFGNADRLREGTQLIVWTGHNFAPSPTPQLNGAPVGGMMTVYDEPGNHVHDMPLQLLAVQQVEVCDCVGVLPYGWLDIRTDEPSFIEEHLHSADRSSAELHAYCLPVEDLLSGPAITIQKRANGEDANVAPGPKVRVGSTVEFEYVITNTGTEPLSSIVVTDNTGLSVSCPVAALDAGASMTCTASTVAGDCENGNIGTVTARTPDASEVTASDPAWYFGDYEPGIEIQTKVNGDDADVAPGVLVDVGSTIEWTYVIMNTGRVRLSNIVVSDNHALAVHCPADALDPGDTMICTASSIALEGQYSSLGKARGNPPCGVNTSASDPAHYFGKATSRPQIVIKKLTNGIDAAEPPGPTLPLRSTVTWTYIITNVGSVTVDNINVNDYRLPAPVRCPKTALAPGEAMTCSETGIVTAPCQYENIVRAVGTGGGQDVEATDVSHYFGELRAALRLEKLVNGVEADLPPGPTIEAGKPVLWTYVVTNESNVELANVSVMDDKGLSVSCPKTTLAAGESMTCTASGIATAGAYRNIGTVTARPSAYCGDQVVATDPSCYLGVAPQPPSIRIKKYVNGSDADTPPGLSVEIGSAITWTYLVTNNGAQQLTNVRVTDDHDVTVTCPKTVLAPAESMTCTAHGTALAGAYKNIGEVVGAATDASVRNQDPAHYFGEPGPQPNIDITKYVNDQDANTAPGPTLDVGSAVLFNYAVKNTGQVALTNVSVFDDKGLTVTCPKTQLAVNEFMTCTASTTAQLGAYKNVGTASGRSPKDVTVTDSDPANYTGVVPPKPAIDLEKLVNGDDADNAPGPAIEEGSDVTWTYTIRNTGNVALSNVALTDDVFGAISCPKSGLNAGESMTCTRRGSAAVGAHRNVGTASGKSPQNVTVTDTDPANYTGKQKPPEKLCINIEKYVNDLSADSPPGPVIEVGKPVHWKYVVKNSSDVALSSVVVTDDRGVSVSCPKNTLAAGETMTCTANGIAMAGQYKNVGTVSGKSPRGANVTDNDPANYFGKAETPENPKIDIQKYVNDQDADSAPGPTIEAGKPVTWKYVVKNIGDVLLSSVSVTDDKRGNISCPRSTLSPNESMTCTSSGTAIAGAYRNVGTATGKSPKNTTVTDSDPANYFGETKECPKISITKYVNDEDANSAPGPSIAVGKTVTWKYVVKNTGDVLLSGVSVTDDKRGTIACPSTTLAPNASMTCIATGSAAAGPYRNVGTASGKSPRNTTVKDDDAANYYGILSSQGCSEGYWKSHPNSWQGYSPSSKVSSLFSKASSYSGVGSATLLEALSFSGGSGTTAAARTVVRAGAAAVLNAAHSGINYPRSTSSVVGAVNDALAQGDRDRMLALAAQLDADNDLSCPLN